MSPDILQSWDRIQSLLIEHDFEMIDPPIRSSDFRMKRETPFTYFLCRSLGLVPLLSPHASKALIHGEWAHNRLFAYAQSAPGDVTAAHLHYNKRIDERADELTAIADSLGLSQDKSDNMIHEMRQDAMTAAAWVDVAVELAPTPKHRSILDILWNVPDQYVFVEPRIPAMIRDSAGVDRCCVAVPDLLVYNAAAHTIHLYDLKTCSGDALNRLQQCPYEDQTLHYLSVVAAHIADPPSGLWPFPVVGATLTGMTHLAMEKPSIKFCSMDRDYTDEIHTPTKGKNPGQPVVKRTYRGEPVFGNYLRRVRDWYTATGEYADLAPELVGNPRVNYSTTSFSPAIPALHQVRLSAFAAASLETCFRMRTSSGIVSFGNTLTPYAPFYGTPIREWPAVRAMEKFTVVRRDTPDRISAPALASV